MAAKKTPTRARRVSTAAEARLADALPPERAAKNPDRPVAVVAEEARRIARLARREKKRLALVDVPPALVDGLALRARLLSEREARWKEAHAALRSGRGPRTVAEAEALKSAIFESARYLFRRDPVIQQRLDELQRGDGQDDLAMDLDQLALFVKEQRRVFDADPTFPRDAFTRARRLARELRVGVSPLAATEARMARNLAFWHASDGLAEVRKGLRYLWRTDPEKLATLGLSYTADASRSYRRRRAARRASAPPDEKQPRS